MEIDRVQGHNMTVRDNNEEQEPESRMWKKKRLGEDDLHEHPMELSLSIRSAEGIDDPVVLGRCYCVLYWIEPDQVYHTRAVRTWLNNPIWNEVDFLPVLNYTPESSGFLNVEIARLCSDTDPGPSSRMVIVGRARVPLPKEPYRRIERRFFLVRLDGKGSKSLAGDIILRMELQRLWVYQHPGYKINQFTDSES